MSTNNTESSKSYFVSDLHLFSRRSQAPRHASAIDLAAQSASTFVLGGDIFDFKWTTLGSIESTVDAAMDWLQSLSHRHQKCHFHFVLGNHDYHELFLPALEELCNSLDNLTCHHYFYRQGRSLYLHGDVADKATHETLDHRRKQGLREQKRGQLPNLLYDLAIQASIHKMAASLKHRKRQVAQRILDYAEHIGHGPSSGLKNVYFGHTHVALSNYEFGGLRFHNGGAPMKGLKFRIVETEH